MHYPIGQDYQRVPHNSNSYLFCYHKPSSSHSYTEKKYSYSMNNNHLLIQFSQGINWNAFMYILYKSLSTILSLLLFKQLSTNDFSVWANTMSVIFLLLLWIDFGLRKSLPRFCPAFARHEQTHRSFIASIITIQLGILIITLPLFLWVAHSTLTFIGLHFQSSLLVLAAALFLTEGIIALLRLIYHSHFHHKQFNTTSSIFLLAEAILSAIAITILQSPNLLVSILAIKLTTNIATILASLALLNQLYQDTTYDQHAPLNQHQLHKDFLLHSGIMWFNTSIKSLTERNFMLPFFTYMFGPLNANIYKIANDSALLLYRATLKSIGTTDTSLLTHAFSSHEPSMIRTALDKLTSTIILLSTPLLIAILVALTAYPKLSPTNHTALQLFFILTTTYLIETLLSPFERILEVNSNYALLFLAYIPYLITITLLFGLQSAPILDMANYLLVIQGSRLIGSLLMTYFAHKKYSLALPTPLRCTTLLIMFACYSILRIMIYHTHMGNHIIYCLNKIITLN